MSELSIIIPCVSSIVTPQFIDELAIYLASNPSDVDIIVIVNERVPSIGRLVHYVRKKYPWLKFEILQRSGGSRRYGALARFGLAYSTSLYAVLISSYGENDISVIPKMLSKIREGAQVVQATRFLTVTDAKKVPLRFRIYQTIYRFLTKVFLGFRISDSTYGFKMFDRLFIQAMGLNQNGYSICPEITFKALLAGGRVEYIASSMKSTPINKDFKLYEEGIKYLWLLIRGFGHRLGLLWF